MAISWKKFLGLSAPTKRRPKKSNAQKAIEAANNAKAIAARAKAKNDVPAIQQAVAVAKGQWDGAKATASATGLPADKAKAEKAKAEYYATKAALDEARAAAKAARKRRG